MSAHTLVRFAFAFNILVLLPVVASLYAQNGPGRLSAFGGKVENVDGLRLMLAALWTGVAFCSAIGLVAPGPFVSLLAFQVIYKAIWLGTAAVPAWQRDGIDAVPMGIAAVFLFIVLLWPAILWAWWRSNGIAPAD